VAAEIQLLACGYSAQCTVRGCGARTTVLARYTDDQGKEVPLTTCQQPDVPSLSNRHERLTKLPIRC
jgi:hypothetical protein